MSIASQFSALPMEDLIGGPLQAAATAQGKLASITSDFITSVGLEDTGGGKLAARTVDFKYQKPVKSSKQTQKQVLLLILGVNKI